MNCKTAEAEFCKMRATYNVKDIRKGIRQNTSLVQFTTIRYRIQKGIKLMKYQTVKAGFRKVRVMQCENSLNS